MSSKPIIRILRFFVCTVLLSLPLQGHTASESCEPSWPAWDSFKKNLVSQDGRVIDYSSETNKTTSEGQAYALFFALVANDRVMFEKLLNWTERNLTPNDLSSRLPAWAWGKNDQGNWGILDNNSASDADLWLAYTLGEAGRLWDERRYIALSSLLANRILQDETLKAPKLGLVLLPGIDGFIHDEQRVHLNPSYLPMQLMRWFTTHSKDPRWNALHDTSQKTIIQSSPRGYAPEWTIYDYERGFLPDDNAEKSSEGSYNAIRVYMWAGMMHWSDPTRQALMDRLMPMGRLVRNLSTPPESVNVLTGTASGTGSSGFSAAMIPFLQAAGLHKIAQQQIERIESHPISGDNYYDQVLSLFALGWHNKLYRFDPTGNITPGWKTKCQ